MRLAVVGSRSIGNIELEPYVSEDVTEIVSGGARGVDALARAFAEQHCLIYTEFLPQYERYGRSAPLKRNEQIAKHADAALAFWDGKSKGTAYTVRLFERLGKPVRVVLVCI